MMRWTASSCTRLWGFLVLAATLFLMFQAVFSWAQLPMDWIKAAVEFTGETLTRMLPAKASCKACSSTASLRGREAWWCSCRRS